MACWQCPRDLRARKAQVGSDAPPRRHPQGPQGHRHLPTPGTAPSPERDTGHRTASQKGTVCLEGSEEHWLPQGGANPQAVTQSCRISAPDQTGQSSWDSTGMRGWGEAQLQGIWEVKEGARGRRRGVQTAHINLQGMRTGAHQSTENENRGITHLAGVCGVNFILPFCT